MLRRLNWTLIVWSMVAGWAGSASWVRGQSTIYVDGSATGVDSGMSWADAYTNLQPALAAAQSGDEVWVASGVYVGTIGLAEGVALYGGFAGTEDPSAFDLANRNFVTNEVILDGNHTKSVVTGPPGATATTRLDGFTITNGGSATSYPRPSYGGGILLRESSPTITNNRITGNVANYRGGGIYVDDASPLITNNTIAGNRSFRNGGGIHVYLGSPAIVGNTITSNSAKSDGGGLYVQAGSPIIAKNRITNNHGSSGGGVYAHSSSALIVNNMIVGNIALGYSSRGGGLYLGGGTPVIENNTIMGNGAPSGGGMYLSSCPADIGNNTITGNAAVTGGGLYLAESSPTIANTIVAFNATGIYHTGTGTSPALISNCVYGNGTYNYSGIVDPTGTDGNISANPRLVSPEYGNWHIQPDSPCVDSGDIAYAHGSQDLDDQLRTQPPGGSVDIGADESDGTVWPEGLQAIVRVSPTGDDDDDGATWATPKRTVQTGITAAAKEGGEVWVQAGTYLENIQLFPYVHLYGGFSGTETARSERDWQNNVTTIDGWDGWRAVVRIHGGDGVSTLDGFTITGGRYGPDDGGGVSVHSSSPTIANNRITDNYNGLGGGLYLYASDAVVSDNSIVGNQGEYGGGMYVGGSSSPTITNNTIASNSSWWYGGGILQSGGSAFIANNLITGNSYGITGAGLALFGGSSTVANNWFVGNLGVAIRVEDPGDNASQVITNNTIIGNQAPQGGGAIYLFGGVPSSIVANNIVAFNDTGILRYWSSPTLANNCVYGNTEYNYSGISDPIGSNGNISVDPLFVLNPDPGPDGIWGTADDDPGDPHLLADSPCINAGNNAYASGDFDFDDSPRLVGCFVDMGAYEYQVALPLPADFDDNCAVDLDDYFIFELCLYSSGPGQQSPFSECLDVFDFDADDDVDLADFAAFSRAFSPQ